MKRSILPRFLAIAAIAALIVTDGCKSPTINYQIVQTASLRVMNFAPNCTSPMDVYWAPLPPGPTNKAANIHYLAYGNASVYTSGIIAAPNGTPYQVVVRPTGDTVGSDIKVPITLEPSGKYTIIVTRDSANPSNFISTTLADGVQPPGSDPTKQTFVRFMNLQSNVGSLSVHVNDPVTGDNITPTSVSFDKYTPYVALNSALDTSYAFFVTNSANQVIARLTYQTFVAGSYYTLVYAGDLCNTPLDNAADTVNDGNDTLRLRAFDDNQNGADQTNPVPLTYRYNIINAISPPSGGTPTITDIGFTVNGADFPEYDNFSIPAIPLDYAGGTGASFSSSDNVINVNYQSGVIPPAPATTLSVAAEALNGNVLLGQLFSANITFGSSSTFDNPIIPNNSMSYLFYDDTIKANLTSAGKNLAFSVPDSSIAGTATLIFVPGVWGSKSVSIQGSLFYYQPGGSSSGNPIITTEWNKLAGGAETGNLAHTGKPAYNVAVPAGGEPITIYDSVYNTASNHLALPTQTFTAYPGGIYEIVSVGNINNPSTYGTLVIRVNN